MLVILTHALRGFPARPPGSRGALRQLAMSGSPARLPAGAESKTFFFQDGRHDGETGYHFHGGPHP
nr:MAG TPA: hypothetical protein [Caudoviricetes sp.]